MSDNSQTTDPLAEENRSYPEIEDGTGVPPAGASYPDVVRDPGKGNTGGAPLWRGSEASDFD